jgi:predicted ArsR family transcriptional regulator
MDADKQPAEYTDINEAVGEEWEAETTPYERVREVVSHIYTPTGADTIAVDARTSPKTARKHLEALVNEGFVSSAHGENGATHYRRSPESLVVEQAADILDRMTTDELVDRIEEMRAELTDLQDKYGVESPEALRLEQTNRALEGESLETEIDQETLTHWQTTRRNLAFANAALSVANAERFVDGNTGSSDGTAVSQ